MWLLEASSRNLFWFSESDACRRYAILSHTWDQDEVTFDDIKDLAVAEKKKGYQKIDLCCKQAVAEGIDHVWIDTCCIDKSSSTELSEAINSMFRWYKQARICYAYLPDVCVSQPVARVPRHSSDLTNTSRLELVRSRWWERGWTLQELIAPTAVTFYGKDWTLIGTRTSLGKVIEVRTGIPAFGEYERLHLPSCSAAQKLSWAANRVTTRPEDRAYSLLGIFDVNMPLLYGEGEEKAFKRLQSEILGSTKDLSLLLWDRPKTYNSPMAESVLASSPSKFANCGEIIKCPVYNEDLRDAFELLTAPFPQLRVTLPVLASGQAVLNFRLASDPSGPLALCLNDRVDAENSGDIEHATYICSSISVIRASELHKARKQRLVLTAISQLRHLQDSYQTGRIQVELDSWCSNTLERVHWPSTQEWSEKEGKWETTADSPYTTLAFSYEKTHIVLDFRVISPPDLRTLVYCRIHRSDGSLPDLDSLREDESEWKWLQPDDGRARSQIADLVLDNCGPLQIVYIPQTYPHTQLVWQLAFQSLPSPATEGLESIAEEAPQDEMILPIGPPIERRARRSCRKSAQFPDKIPTERSPLESTARGSYVTPASPKMRRISAQFLDKIPTERSLESTARNSYITPASPIMRKNQSVAPSPRRPWDQLVLESEPAVRQLSPEAFMIRPPQRQVENAMRLPDRSRSPQGQMRIEMGVPDNMIPDEELAFVQPEPPPPADWDWI